MERKYIWCEKNNHNKMQPRAGVAVSTRSARGTVWSWGKWCHGRCRWGTWWRPPGRESWELMPGPGQQETQLHKTISKLVIEKQSANAHKKNQR